MLARAMVAGRLTAAEYSDRAAIALGARVRRDLVGLLDDLPGAALHASLEVDVLDLEAGVGGAISRHGWWRVPPTVRVHSWVGPVKLDFTEAEFVAPVVVIELATGMCSPEIVLPCEATADVDELRISVGRVRDDLIHHRERGTPHVTVRGRHSVGEVALRHPRRPRWRRLRGRVPPAVKGGLTRSGTTPGTQDDRK